MFAMSNASDVNVVGTLEAAIQHSTGMELIVFALAAIFAIVLRRSPSKTKRPKTPGHDGNGLFHEAGRDRRPELATRGGKGSMAVDAVAALIDDTVNCAAKIPPKKVLAVYHDAKQRGALLLMEEAARLSKYSPLQCFCALLQCAGRGSPPQAIEELLDDMCIAGVYRPLAVYESAMKLLAAKKCYREALAVYDKLDADGLRPSAVTLSCLIRFAVELQELDRALIFFESLSEITTPSIRACMTVLGVHGKRKDWPSSRSFLGRMHRMGITVDAFALNIALATGVACGKMQEVEEVLEEVDIAPVVDSVSYNTLLKGYARGNQADRAMAVLARMRERGVEPNLISYNTAIDAAVRSGEVGNAWQIYEDLRGAGLHPDKCTCSTLVKGLQVSTPTAEQLCALLDLFELVAQQSGATLRNSLLGSVLEATTNLGQEKPLMRTLSQIEAHDVTLSIAEYQLAFSALARSMSDTTRCIELLWQHVAGAHLQQAVGGFPAIADMLCRHGRGHLATQALRDLEMRAAAAGLRDEALQGCRDALAPACAPQAAGPARLAVFPDVRVPPPR